MVENKKGCKSHLFFGHGPSQEVFEKRDHGTTNELVYDKLQKTQTIIDPHNYCEQNRQLDKLQCNVKPQDLPGLFGPEAAKQSLAAQKPKSYNQFTKKFDNNSLKLGLRT